MFSIPVEIDGAELLDSELGALVELGLEDKEYERAIAVYGMLKHQKRKHPSTVCLALLPLPLAKNNPYHLYENLHLHPEIDQIEDSPESVKHAILKYALCHQFA